MIKLRKHIVISLIFIFLLEINYPSNSCAESELFEGRLSENNIKDQISTKESVDARFSTDIYSKWKVRLLYGYTINITDIKNKKLVLLPSPEVHPLGVTGFEYGWILKKKYYIGAEVNFMLFPSMFTEEARIITILKDYPVKPGWLLIFWPNIHFHFGLIFENNMMFTTGLFYLWGLVNTLSVPITERFVFESRFLWFYDRVFFLAGLHDFHINIGFSYKLSK